jgi:hypothetical protein
MAWTAPMTAVANAVFTAAQFNTHVRDNLLETAPAKATASGGIFVGTGANSIAERFPDIDFIQTLETTASSSYVDLSSAGPAVSVTTGVNALVILTCNMESNTAGGISNMGCTISGATSESATESNSLRYESGSSGDAIQASFATIYTTLTAGSNTFTAKYKTNGAGTSSFSARKVSVLPF